MKLASYILTLILPDLRSNVAHAVLIMMVLLVKTVWMIYIPVWISLIRMAIKGHLQERHSRAIIQNARFEPYGDISQNPGSHIVLYNVDSKKIIKLAQYCDGYTPKIIPWKLLSSYQASIP